MRAGWLGAEGRVLPEPRIRFFSSRGQWSLAGARQRGQGARSGRLTGFGGGATDVVFSTPRLVDHRREQQTYARYLDATSEDNLKTLGYTINE